MPNIVLPPAQINRPPTSTGPARTIAPADIYKPSAPIKLGAGPVGPPVQIAFKSRYLTVISATFPDNLQISFDGNTFQPWPAGISLNEIPDVDFIWLRNTNAAANTVVIAAGSAKITDQRLVVPPLTIVPVTAAASTAASGPTAFASVASAPILAANPARKGFTIYNPPGNPTLWFNLGAVAAVVGAAGVALSGGQYYESPFSFQGAVTGIMAAAGSVYVQELT
jgi:hypothetical protein